MIIIYKFTWLTNDMNNSKKIKNKNIKIKYLINCLFSILNILINLYYN